MIEDFTGCSSTEFNYNPITNWDINTDYTGQTWTVNDPAIIDQKYNIGHKPALIFSNHVGTRTRVSVPKILYQGRHSPHGETDDIHGRGDTRPGAVRPDTRKRLVQGQRHNN